MLTFNTNRVELLKSGQLIPAEGGGHKFVASKCRDCAKGERRTYIALEVPNQKLAQFLAGNTSRGSILEIEGAKLKSQVFEVKGLFARFFSHFGFLARFLSKGRKFTEYEIVVESAKIVTG